MEALTDNTYRILAHMNLTCNESKEMDAKDKDCRSSVFPQVVFQDILPSLLQLGNCEKPISLPSQTVMQGILNKSLEDLQLLLSQVREWWFRK
ncbi:hypothetical protein TNIN_244901 [Trichonephila inaurata madagascariensis]|uniref:Uncharacterized protein n=1 Tax=Trichonephila inaurata madagascariensis TaxID=2747483 RepID=A0A8X6Y2Q6_9ARAC|nr:hypothetical protein TNIN_244901 [Trichonephila inaurata madagascariensis]